MIVEQLQKGKLKEIITLHKKGLKHFKKYFADVEKQNKKNEKKIDKFYGEQKQKEFEEL